MNRRIAECINILGDFCGKRDVDEGRIKKNIRN